MGEGDDNCAALDGERGPCKGMSSDTLGLPGAEFALFRRSGGGRPRASGKTSERHCAVTSCVLKERCLAGGLAAVYTRDFGAWGRTNPVTL